MALIKPNILYLGQYELEHIDSAPKVRTYALFQELTKISRLTFITGYRSSRRWPLLRFLCSGKLSEIDAVYLEAATSTSMEVDFLILILARLMNKPVGIFIRDAFPMFNIIEKSSLKHRCLIILWRLSLWMYQNLATVLYYPSERFSQLFTNKKQKSIVLPPGGRQIPMIPLDKTSKTLLYVGGLGPVYAGIIELFKAIDRVFSYEPKIRLICVCRKKELESIQEWLQRPWLDIRHLQTHEIPQLRDEVLATVISLNPSAYADLALPVKIFDYLSFGRPILASNSLSIAEFIKTHQVGMISECNGEAFKEAIDYLFSEPDILDSWAKNAIEQIQKAHSWEHRAEEILKTLLD